jgi:hypothetical protein
MNSSQYAFPCSLPLEHHDLDTIYGLTKREYFAALIMAQNTGGYYTHDLPAAAKRAVDAADALLDALKTQ